MIKLKKYHNSDLIRLHFSSITFKDLENKAYSEIWNTARLKYSISGIEKTQIASDRPINQLIISIQFRISSFSHDWMGGKNDFFILISPLFKKSPTGFIEAHKLERKNKPNPFIYWASD